MLRQFKRLSHAGVKRAALTYDAIRPPQPGAVVLAYHRVGAGTGLEVDLEASVFADQMAYLAASCEPWSLDHCVDRLEESDGPAAVVVSFDDGTADFIDFALPALVESNVPATYYIATKFVDEQIDFPNDGKPMTWAALAEAVSTGLVTIGSHTHSHAVMDKLTPDEADEELRISNEMIEDRLGVKVEHFAYPKGVFGGEAVEQRLAKRFRSAALANCTTNVFGNTDPLRLDRAPIQRADGMRYFEAKVRGGLQLEGQLRSKLNAKRYNDLAN